MKQLLSAPPCCFTLIVTVMSSTTAALMKVSDLAAKSFVQRSLALPSRPASVLSFFFGLDYEQQGQYQQEMRYGRPLETMKHFWFQGGAEFDELCQPFAETINSVGQQESSVAKDAEWRQHVDGLIAQLILCDQLARNIFRGQPAAFAYDEHALSVARQLAKQYLETCDGPDGHDHVPGELYPPYVGFIVTALMHSESVADHQKCIQVVQRALQAAREPHLQAWWNYQMQYELDHKIIIDRFGRYPHRNAIKGRASTADEEAWLADTDHLPGWASSQK